MSSSIWAESLNLNLRSQSNDATATRETIKRVTWESEKTALIICDMWDDHWCKSASHRVEEMAPVLNDIVKTARAKGVFIIHAPSSVVDFYKDTPQRKHECEFCGAADHKSKACPKKPDWAKAW